MDRLREVVYDTSIGKWLYKYLQDDHSQRRLVMLIVCVALLLDNMLYMVIVPIIPDYLRRMAKWDDLNFNNTNFWTMPLPEKEEGEDQRIGSLFASKAFIQLLINPFSGHIIDRIGYEKPMMVGLIIMFFSTSIFAIGKSYGILLIARSLQGVGSAFANTAGLAMIADRFSDEAERQKMLGIAIAFISFGSLFAPPFGGVLYELAGKFFPFFILSMVCLADGLALTLVMRPMEDLTVKTALQRQKTIDVSAEQAAVPSNAQPTPIWKLLMDPYIAICGGALVMANVSLAFLEPTLAIWMQENMPHVTQWQTGIVWLPAFFPHVIGVVMTISLCQKYPRYQYMVAATGLAIEGLSTLFIPISNSFWFLMLPISGICFGVALIDTALLPTLGYLVDTRHTSVYGSVYAIADISYNLAYSIGPVVAGHLVASIGFTGLNCIVALLTLAYVPIMRLLKNVYKYDPTYGESGTLLSGAKKNAASAANVKYQQWNGDDDDDDDDFNTGGGKRGDSKRSRAKLGWARPAETAAAGTDGYGGIGGGGGGGGGYEGYAGGAASMPGSDMYGYGSGQSDYNSSSATRGGANTSSRYGAMGNENYSTAATARIAPDPPSGEHDAYGNTVAGNTAYYNNQQQQQGAGGYQSATNQTTNYGSSTNATADSSGQYYQPGAQQNGGW